MADIGKSALKDKIDLKIVQNSRQQITGTILNDVLNDAVDTLADGGNLDAGSIDTPQIANNAVWVQHLEPELKGSAKSFINLSANSTNMVHDYYETIQDAVYAVDANLRSEGMVITFATDESMQNFKTYQYCTDNLTESAFENPDNWKEVGMDKVSVSQNTQTELSDISIGGNIVGIYVNEYGGSEITSNHNPDSWLRLELHYHEGEFYNSRNNRLCNPTFYPCKAGDVIYSGDYQCNVLWYSSPNVSDYDKAKSLVSWASGKQSIEYDGYIRFALRYSSNNEDITDEMKDAMIQAFAFKDSALYDLANRNALNMSYNLTDWARKAPNVAYGIMDTDSTTRISCLEFIPCKAGDVIYSGDYGCNVLWYSSPHIEDYDTNKSLKIWQVYQQTIEYDGYCRISLRKNEDNDEISDADMAKMITTFRYTNAQAHIIDDKIDRLYPNNDVNYDYGVADENGNIIFGVTRGNIYSQKFNSEWIGNYYGKKFSIMGDSISTFGTDDSRNIDGVYCHSYAPSQSCRYSVLGNVTEGGTTYESFAFKVNDTWWMRVINGLGGTLARNDSYRGSSVSTVRNAPYMASQERVNYLGENGTPDVILVFGGTNDAQRRVTIGTIDTSAPPKSAEEIAALTADTFADAYRTMLIRMMYTYPNAEIVSILPTFTSSYYSIATLDLYVECIKEVCDLLGVKWIDIRATNINPYNVSDYMESDGLHPNELGMKVIADKVIKNLIFR